MEDKSAEQVSDPMTELNAMKAVADALTGLHKDAVSRVLQWAAGSFGASIALPPRAKFGPTKAEEDDSGAGSQEFDSLADLYAVAQPKTDADRALVPDIGISLKRLRRSLLPRRLTRL